MSESRLSPGLSPLLKLGEEKLTQLLTQLLANDSFVKSLQGAISGALKAKGTMDKGLIQLLSTFNVPTVEDVALMQQKLTELEEAVADLTRIVVALEEKTRPAGEGRAPRGKSRRHADPTGE
ncbi:MAG: hypothetical protein HY904_21275 [Deltaproteobacteria bacterium]|nr:hypothetical protein [Deltaproteobacteria bacterium]